jgi:peptidoglycan/LPS O-acetylase OafA/YrhL
LFTVLAGVCVYVIVALPHEAATYRGDASAALGYVTNWWLILRGQSYFGGTGRPSLLINLWSLAVEEQFYLLWPLILAAVLKVRSGRKLSVFFVTAAIAAGSALAMRALYSPWRDPSRVYYGSDTRAFELLIGAGLAVLYARTSTRTSLGVTRRWRVAACDALGAGALGALGLAVVAVPASSPWLYPLGLLAACGAAALVIVAATSSGLVARFLALRPLVWLGERSYSLYLWHWPVFDVTRPGSDVHLPVAADFALRIGVSLLLAHLTFRYIEQPIRHGAIGRMIARSRAALRQQRFTLPTGVAAMTVALVACGTGLGDRLIDTAHRYPANPNAIAEDSGPALTLTGAGPAARAASSPNTARPAHVVSTPSASASAVPTAMPAPPAHPPTIAFVGDSQGMTLLLNKPANLGEYLTAIDDTTEGCGFLGGDISSRDGERRDLDADCGGSAAKWAARAARQHPAAVVVMIGGWDEFDETVSGTTMRFGTAAWDAYYTARLTDAMRKLSATGVPRIELSLLPCYRPVPEPGSGYWPERGEDSRTRHINALLTAYAQTHATPWPGTVRTLQPPPAFCTDPHIATSLDYRWDGTHYYKPGSALYFQSAIPQLLAPLP